MYDSPIWGIEDNDWGILTITMAQELRYRKLYYRDAITLMAHIRQRRHVQRLPLRVVGDLIEAIHLRAITIPNGEGLSQFFTVIRNPDKRGRIEAQSGTHDDYPMAVGIAWQLRQYARPAAGENGRPERSANRRRRRGWSRWG